MVTKSAPSKKGGTKCDEVKELPPKPPGTGNKSAEQIIVSDELVSFQEINSYRKIIEDNKTIFMKYTEDTT